MQSRRFIAAVLLTAGACLVLVFSCAPTPMKTEPPPVPTEASAEDGLPPGWEILVSEDIYFEKGSWSLTAESRQLLREKALWLLANPSVNVVVQGHSDESGSDEFNLALGDRRAGSVKSFLIEAGIDRERIAAVSYGREKPAEMSKDEESRNKNRRVHIDIDLID